MIRTSTRATRTPRVVAIAFAVGLAAALAVGVPASAHTQVAPASPEPGSTVTTGPVTIALNTTEPVLESGRKSIVVTGPGDDERYFGDGCATVTNGTTLSADVTLGEPGEYTVIWTLVAEDGHQQSSADFEPFTFTWQPDDGEETVEGAASVPRCGHEPSADASDDGGSSSDALPESNAQGDEAPGDEASEPEGSDIGWLIAAGGIVFIAAAAVVMILVRRRMLADDAEDEDAPSDVSAGETGVSSGDSSSGDGPPSS
ncbi:copper resistance CopC family protein [Paramicrobacterium chengjingii]|uniref:Copper resistance protein CopC n=1 Tax=Paramicrobacterium chengjingii TaxID=2769067 RepID=A0ABX6YGS6_9MICO|nr:copper resistance CopC family protein [Microbacterium chengjingii]QPZ37651.1 copper resistance protein CopC [Microbacterium chengjingii]